MVCPVAEMLAGVVIDLKFLWPKFNCSVVGSEDVKGAVSQMFVTDLGAHVRFELVSLAPCHSGVIRRASGYPHVIPNHSGCLHSRHPARPSYRQLVALFWVVSAFHRSSYFQLNAAQLSCQEESHAALPKHRRLLKQTRCEQLPHRLVPITTPTPARIESSVYG